MSKLAVLVVDDEKEIREALKINLERENISVYEAENGLEAIEITNAKKIHLILMDIMMPIKNGIDAAIEIRKNNDIPIIFLSAKSEDKDIILGLNVGADDYITKPFKSMEVVARVKSNLRRYTKYDGFKESSHELLIDGLYLNKKTKEVKIEGVLAKLTPIEFKILELLMDNTNITFSIEEIYEKVWQEAFYNGENTVAVHIRRIREKIEVNPKEPRYLKVVWGVGYKIEKQ